MRVPLLSTFSSHRVCCRSYSTTGYFSTRNHPEITQGRPLYTVVLTWEHMQMLQEDISLITRFPTMAAVRKLPDLRDRTFSLREDLPWRLVSNTVWAAVTVGNISVKDFIRANRGRYLPVLIDRSTIMIPSVELLSASELTWTIFGEVDTWERRVLRREDGQL